MKRLLHWLAAWLLALFLALGAAGCSDGSSSTAGSGTSAPQAAGEGPHGSELAVHVLDIGQGDAILLSKDGKWALIDSGDVDHRPEMKRYLKEYGVDSLSSVIITHPHADHVGGMLAVFQTVPVEAVYDSGVPTSTNTYRTYLKQIKAKNIPFHVVKAGDVIPLFEDVDFHVVAPVETITEGKKKKPDLNNNSIVGRLTYGASSMLFTGDAEKDEEETILESGASLRSDVLKVGHHGSKTSSSPAFVKAVSPGAAVLSAGAGNSYGLPHQATLDRLAQGGVSHIFRTDRDGTVTFVTDGSGGFRVYTKKEK